jgi:NADPH2:quinone reductase
MKALLSTAPGGPETLVLTDILEPRPGPGHLRIAVRACGVNFPDSLIIEDKYQLRPARPFAPGAEVAGIVDAVGEGVSDEFVGRRVIGWVGFGGMAEKIVLAAERAAPMPDAMPFDVAASFVLTYGTSQHALKDRAAIKPGETLLVLGAAGGVGLAAVELGKAYGARVVAAVSSPEKAELATAHGADAAIVYPTGPFDGDGRKTLSKLFKDAVGENGADVVYDPVGGDYTEAALRAIAWEGRLLVVGFPAGIPKLPLNLTLLKSCQVMGVFWGAFVARDPAKSRANLAELLSLWAEGKLRPEISGSFPLERGGEAIAALAARKASGKLVVTIGAG